MNYPLIEVFDTSICLADKIVVDYNKALKRFKLKDLQPLKTTLSYYRELLMERKVLNSSSLNVHYSDTSITLTLLNLGVVPK